MNRKVLININEQVEAMNYHYKNAMTQSKQEVLTCVCVLDKLALFVHVASL